jgi:5-formyltetrahydrofolate cyclo-ligase
MLAPVTAPGHAERVRVAKNDLRARVLSSRAARPPAERERLAALIASRVRTLREVREARVVAAYVGVGDELPTLPLLDALAPRRVLLPVLLDDASLAWGAYDGTLVSGPRGLREPPRTGANLDAADVVIAPGVAYDVTGRRLGRGGGSYDRALASVRAPVVALATDDEVVGEVPVEPHDVRVDVIVTPTRVIYAVTEIPTPPRVSAP